MNLIERVEYLLKQQGDTLQQRAQTAPPLKELWEEKWTSAEEVADQKLEQLAAQLDCPWDYLVAVKPFDDLALLEEKKGDISIHLKLMLAIKRQKQDILYGISFLDYLRLVDLYIAEVVRTNSGLDVSYK